MTPSHTMSWTQQVVFFNTDSTSRTLITQLYYHRYVAHNDTRILGVQYDVNSAFSTFRSYRRPTWLRQTLHIWKKHAFFLPRCGVISGATIGAFISPPCKGGETEGVKIYRRHKWNEMTYYTHVTKSIFYTFLTFVSAPGQFVSRALQIPICICICLLNHCHCNK